MLTPILAFTSEEIWSQLKRKTIPLVFSFEWPEAKDKYANQEVENKIDQVLVVREVVTKALRSACQESNRPLLGSGLAFMPIRLIQRLQQVEALEKLFIVSRWISNHPPTTARMRCPGRGKRYMGKGTGGPGREM